MGLLKDKTGRILCGICRTWHAPAFDCQNDAQGTACVEDTVTVVVDSPIRVEWPDKEPLDLTPYLERFDIGSVSFVRMVGGVSVSLVDQDGMGFSRDYLDKEFRDLFCREVAYKSEMNWPHLSIVVLAVGIWAGVIAALI